VALAQVPLLVCFGALAVTALAVAVLLAVSVELVGKGTGPRASAEGG
jgi:hypothetical protein